MQYLRAFCVGLASSNQVSYEEQVKKWRLVLKGSQRRLDLDCRESEIIERRMIQEARAAVIKGESDPGALKITAAAIVKNRKARLRLIECKGKLSSVYSEMRCSSAMRKVTSAISASTNVMTSINSLVSIPQIRENMLNMAREMHKSGYISEMIDDSMDWETDDGEENTDVDGVLKEILAPPLNSAAEARKTRRAETAKALAEREAEVYPPIPDAELDEIDSLEEAGAAGTMEK